MDRSDTTLKWYFVPVPNTFVLISDSNLRYQVMSLIVNLGLTQKSPSNVFIIYYAENKTTSSEFISLLEKTSLILANQKVFVNIEYRILDSNEYHDLVGQFEVPKNSHITKTAYLRYFLDILVDDCVDRLLYLDIDVLVKDDLSELFELEFDEVIAASVSSPDYSAEGRHLPNFSGEYFNSGVLLINLKKWRDQKISDELVKVSQGKYLPYLDQDGLNLVFANKWKKIGRKFNWFHDATKRQIDIDAWPLPSIIHFVGLKPWNMCVETEYVMEYRISFERVRELSKILESHV